MHQSRAFFLVSVLVTATAVSPARADEVTDWNRVLFRAAAAGGTSPLTATRNAAIVQAAVFDAVNGIDRTFTSIREHAAAPSDASRRAAVVQAAYASLLRLYHSQQQMLDGERGASLQAISSGHAADSSASIARGIEWGQRVADDIWAWRRLDGFSADGVTQEPLTFDGAPVANGRWRPTPPAFLRGVGYPSFAFMTPWVMAQHYSFRPGGPPALGSSQYLADFNETKNMTNLTRSHPTADQTILSLFWNAGTASAYWDRIATSLSQPRGFTLAQNARLLAFVNLAMADAAIACWDAKYMYVYWRPITAITVADDGIAGTVQDPGWTTLFATPNHPEYPSGHSCVSGAAGRVLARSFGDATPFSIESNTVSGQFRQFASFSAALEEVKNARIFSGIHFRTATEVGQNLGIAIADHVLANALVPAKH